MSRRTSRGRSDRTQVERAYSVLEDHGWHSTRELARRVGHCFGGAIFRLRHYHGYAIDKRKHPRRAGQWQYRLRP